MIELLLLEENNVKGKMERQIIKTILDENPKLQKIILLSESEKDFIFHLREWIFPKIKNNKLAYRFYNNEIAGFDVLKAMSWKDVAAIRLLDYIDNNNKELVDLNKNAKLIKNNTLELFFNALKFGEEKESEAFLVDFLYLFRQLNGNLKFSIPQKKEVKNWMERHPSGLDTDIVEIREKNKKRIIGVLLNKIDSGEIQNKKYNFPEGISYSDKLNLMNLWWNDRIFHLQFAIRKPDLLNELLDFSLSKETMDVLHKAEAKKIPFFINPYYLSLINIDENLEYKNSDLAIRQYVFYSNELIEEFGKIVAWEKEDIVKLGEPNAAGWILPSADSVHRRYPEVAILIPPTVGRACAGLCVSCQRMYDFQRGHLNFNLDKLRPKLSWTEKLRNYLDYFENDSQLRDILITGGDALMSTDKSLKIILDSVYEMTLRKKKANELRADGEKYAEILRVRLGTRILAYLPQRITHELIAILSKFKEKALKIGIQQFVVQTHFETSMEITPEALAAIKKIQSAGWIITNQLVLTAAASRRGHTAKLRSVLNSIGIISYYTFSVKGYKENMVNFATNARAVQEQREEKYIGLLTPEIDKKIKELPAEPRNIVQNLSKIKEEEKLEFIATDRNVLNLPGVGKSLSYRVIGLTEDGRRILKFRHDHTRNHSPIIEKMGEVVIIESKSILEFLEQLKSFGEDIKEYETIWGFSVSQTEERSKIFEYPEYDYVLTNEHTNLSIQN